MINFLSFLPSLVAGGLFGGGAVGIPLTAILAFSTGAPFWIIVIPLSCLALSTFMFLFLPGLMFANYYVTQRVSHLRSGCGADGTVCQLTARPRGCRGARAFFEDADDLGILSIEDGVLKFCGDHSDLKVDLSSIVRIELCNIGWRGLWFASRRIRLHLLGKQEIEAIEIAERQCWTVTDSRRLMLHIFESIRHTT